MKAEAIKKLAVVSIDNGAKLGNVDDVIFDPKGLRVAAVRISAHGQQAILPFDEIRSVGSDAITIPSHDLARWSVTASPLTSLPRLDDVKKLKVVDEAGTFLGTVHDVTITPTDGRIAELEVRKGGILGIGGETHVIHAQEITSVGDEVIVVPVRATEGQRQG